MRRRSRNRRGSPPSGRTAVIDAAPKEGRDGRAQPRTERKTTVRETPAARVSAAITPLPTFRRSPAGGCKHLCRVDYEITDDDGDTHEGNGQPLEDYYAFGEPVTAPADGAIVAAEDDLRDHPAPGSARFEWRTWNIVGNYVVIKHDNGEYSTLAHLREGSVTVGPGDEVSRGDVVGECGNSGMSTEPHLHFQIQDHSNFWIAAGLVPQFRDIEVRRPDDRRADHDVYGSPDEADTLYLWAGDRAAGTEGGEPA